MEPSHPPSEIHPLVKYLVSDHPDTIILLSNIHTGFLDFISPSCEEIMGYSGEDLMKEGIEFWGRITHPEDVQENRQKFADFFSEGQQEGFNHLSLTHFTIRFRIRHGKSEEWVLLENHNVILSYTDEGIPRKLLGIIRRLEEDNKGKSAEDSSKDKKSKKGMLKVTFVGGERVSITDREEEVLKLISQGHSATEIADILVLSYHTVITHRKNLLKKFKAKNTASLITEASKIFWLE